MLCQNCGEREANVKYTQIVNGVKKEMHLCETCSKELGIEEMDFSMPIDLSSFLGEFFQHMEEPLLPDFMKQKPVQCEQCGMTFDDFVQNSKFGCQNCYTTFSEQIDQILKHLHGTNQHVGRKGKKLDHPMSIAKQQTVKEKEKTPISKQEELKEKLKKAIQEERYEDAAILRDEIKKLEE